MSRGDITWQREKEILGLINAYRKKNNKSPLKWNTICAHYAEQHSKYMAENKSLSHDYVNERLNEIKKKVKGYQIGSENVAMSHPNEFNPIEAWSKSSGHNKNMLGVFTDCGVGYVKNSNNDHYYTAIFIRVGQ
jgi:uncharacterized protein YkwD